MNNLITWTPGVTLDEIEKQAVKYALHYFGGNKTATARALGIATRTLDYKLERWNGTVKADAHLQDTETGLPMESSDENSEKQSLPVRKRKKV